MRQKDNPQNGRQYLQKKKKKRKTIEGEKLEISSRKLELPREHFMQKWAQ